MSVSANELAPPPPPQLPIWRENRTIPRIRNFFMRSFVWHSRLDPALLPQPSYRRLPICLPVSARIFLLPAADFSVYSAAPTTTGFVIPARAGAGYTRADVKWREEKAAKCEVEFDVIKRILLTNVINGVRLNKKRL